MQRSCNEKALLLDMHRWQCVELRSQQELFCPVSRSLSYPKHFPPPACVVVWNVCMFVFPHHAYWIVLYREGACWIFE